MKIRAISKYFIILVLSLTTSTSYASKRDTRLELFNQLADKITSLYLKEALVGLEVLDETYGDDILLENIENRLNRESRARTYLIKKGFNLRKIREIIAFIDKTLPGAEEVMKSNKREENIIKKLVKVTLIDKNSNINFSSYEKDIEILGRDIYSVLPKGAKETIDKYFHTQDEREEAVVRVLIEFLYTRHGQAVYDSKTGDFVSLSLRIDDEFIRDVNNALGVDMFNSDVEESLNLFLGALEDTLKQKNLDRVYSDISSVIALLDLNHINDGREDTVDLELDCLKDVSNEVEGDFNDLSITRSETLKAVLSKLDLEPVSYRGEFKDVFYDDSYADYIATGKSRGLINGYKDNTFRPKARVSRSEMMTIIANASEYVYGEINLTERDIEHLMKDYKHKTNIKPWAREATARLVHLKIIDSDYKKEYGKSEFVSRNEAMNLIEKLDKN